MAGHTHGPVDRWFALAMQALFGSSYATLESMFGLLQARLKEGVMWEHSKDVYQWKESRPAWCNIDANHVKNIGLPHWFRLHVDRAGQCVIESKRWLTESTWSPSQVLLDAAGMTRLRGFEPTSQTPDWDRSTPGRHSNRDGMRSWLDKLQKLMDVNRVDNFTSADTEHLRKAPN